MSSAEPGLVFEWPWLLLAAPLPLLLRHFLPAVKPWQAALKTPFFERLNALPTLNSGATRAQSNKLPWLWAIWLLLLLACSRPLWLGEAVEIPNSGRDLLLAVDISGSMKIQDMQRAGQATSRLEIVKEVVGEFTENRRGDRLGLILFGTNPYLHTPLTFDHATLKTLLNEAQIGFAGEKTGIGDAITLAVKHLAERPAESRVLILLTDGADTASEISPRQATKLAAERGITIYAIGFGADEMIVSGFFRQRRINPSAELDENTLQTIASETGGRYFRARNREELKEIYKLLNDLEPVEQMSKLARPQSPLYPWPLAIAFILSLGIALPRPRFTSKPA